MYTKGFLLDDFGNYLWELKLHTVVVIQPKN